MPIMLNGPQEQPKGLDADIVCKNGDDVRWEKADQEWFAERVYALLDELTARKRAEKKAQESEKSF